MRCVFWVPESRLSGVDKASIAVLKDNIRAERFSAAHYIAMYLPLTFPLTPRSQDGKSIVHSCFKDSLSIRCRIERAG
jgi:hypothetical protein